MKKEKIFMIFVPILLLIATVLAYSKFLNTENYSAKFKNEYESLNKDYYKVKVDIDSPINYASYDKIYDILKNDTGIIYLGYAKDNNSRYAINTLLKLVKEQKVDTTVYYLDIHSDRDSYTIQDKDVVYELDSNGKKIKGNKKYLKLVKLLDEYLPEYTITLDGVEYSTGVKRIHFPTIIFVKEGKVLGLEYASLDIEYDALYDIFEGYILDMYSEVCETNTKTPC